MANSRLLGIAKKTVRLAGWTLLGLLSLAAFLKLAPLIRPQNPPAAVSVPDPTALYSQLELRNGRLHRIGDAIAFTGVMTEEYPDGTLKSRSTIVEGLLHGLSQGWHTNGVLQVSEHFEAGICHGLRTKYYASGQRMSEGSISNAHFHGLYQRWHENGQLAERVEYDSGHPKGVALAYTETGSLKARVVLQDVGR